MNIYEGLSNSRSNAYYYGGEILQNGLCNLNKEFVKSIIKSNFPQKDAILWGAIKWPNYYDIMHFQLNSTLKAANYDYIKNHSDFKNYNFSKTY
ncbi:MAG: hypothetical protein AB9846_02400 [Tenuifilaceae bacterium]